MYKDRGIIKWAPFDALNGFRETIELYKYNKGKKAKPVLDENQLEEMDRTIKEAISDSKEIQVSYFEDGYIKDMYGFVKKVDVIYKEIIFSKTLKLDMNDVVNIAIID